MINIMDVDPLRGYHYISVNYNREQWFCQRDSKSRFFDIKDFYPTLDKNYIRLMSIFPCFNVILNHN